MAQQRMDKEELRHDAFRDSMFDAIDFLHKRLKLVIAVSAAAVVIVAAGIGYYVYLQHQTNLESDAYHNAEKLLAQPGGTPEDRIKQTQSALEAFVKAYPNSRLTPAALNYLGRFAFEQKNWDQVESAYQRALANSHIDPTQRAVALVGLGKLREAQGKPAEATAFFDQITDKHFEDLRSYAVGTAELAAGKTEAARKQFQLAAGAQPATTVSGWAKDALDYLP